MRGKLLRIGNGHDIYVCERPLQGLFKVNVNHDLEMPLTYLMARSSFVTYAFEWENDKMPFHGETLQNWANK